MAKSADRKKSRFSSLVWRLLGAAVLVPVFIWVFKHGGLVIFLACAAWIVKMMHEFGKMSASRGHGRLFPVMSPLIVLILAAFHFRGPGDGLAVFTLAALFIFGFDAIRGRIENSTAHSGEKLLILFYLGVLPGHWLLVRSLPLTTGHPYEAAGFWLLFGAGVTWLSDTFAYFVGKSIGRHRLRSLVSPRKTVEGLVGGVLGGVLSAWILHGFFIPQIALWQALVAGLLITVTGQIGDLFESLLKRDAAVKDSGREIPGHGGFLDRVDSMLFSLPVFYYFLRWILGAS